MKNSEENTIRIRALWTLYGPRFHHAGRNTDCVRPHDSWTLAAYDLICWIERNHSGKSPVFYGPEAKAAEEGWRTAMKKSK